MKIVDLDEFSTQNGNAASHGNISRDTIDSLPIKQAKSRIMAAIRSNQVLIVQSETGSGKTTQIPQFLYQAGYSKYGIIGCTQPRKVAAISLAKRVSKEMSSKLGETVGYSVRFEDCTTDKVTKIKFMTDGMLLRELLNDSNLRRYSVIILDEAHERTLRTDILFGMIKRILPNRPELKVVIMSATLDAEKFSSFLNNAEILRVPGRLFPVKLMTAKEPQQDYIESTVVTVFQIHKEYPLGDILVFLTGQEEIESVEKIILQNLSQLPPDCPKLYVVNLFANMPTAQQNEVFIPTPKGSRKVVLATNVAETSITIPGIKYVIDCGLRKIRGFISRTGVDILSIQPISKSNARQRAGRAGREGPGICFRLFTEKSFNELKNDDEPEIKRSSLSNVLLLLKASGINDVVNFDFLDPPSRDAMIKSLEELYALGALNDDQTLTAEGLKMASFPLDPPFSKTLLEASKFGCVREIIDVISLLSVESIFYTPTNRREEAYEARKAYISYEGDVLTYYNILKAFLKEKDSSKHRSEWMKSHFLSARSMNHVLEVRKQLVEYASKLEGFLDSKGNEESKLLSGSEKLLCSLMSGFFTKIAVKQPDNSYKSLHTQQILYIHPSSVLFNSKPELVLYTEVIFSSKHYIRNVSRADVKWLSLINQKYLTSVTN